VIDEFIRNVLSNPVDLTEENLKKYLKYLRKKIDPNAPDEDSLSEGSKIFNQSRSRERQPII
jgi:hypothetical protein